MRKTRSPVEVSYSHDMTRKVFCLPRQLLMEFRELIVFPSGLSESEIIRSLLIQSIKEEKRFKASVDGNGNGKFHTHRKSSS